MAKIIIPDAYTNFERVKHINVCIRLMCSLSIRYIFTNIKNASFEVKYTIFLKVRMLYSQDMAERRL